MKFVTLQCLNCCKEYKRYKSEITKGSSFCTRLCANAYRTIHVNCLRCGNKFETYRSELTRNGAKFCSRKCYLQDEIFINCLSCNKRIKVFKSAIIRGGGKYCSHECYSNRVSPYESFFKNISNENHLNDCWVWIGNKDKNGYGISWFKKAIRAHRFSWILHKGEIKYNLMVCHHCDNPPCVNPDHLFLGTALDNARDRDMKIRLKNLLIDF